MKRAITKDMTIGEIVRRYPKSTEILSSHGMHCRGCDVLTWETLEQCCSSQGIDIEKVLEELNRIKAKQR